MPSLSTQNIPSNYSYPGGELDLFREANRWSDYLGKKLAPYIVGDVLEVGAGLGARSQAYLRPHHRSWTCLEPDPQLTSQLQANLKQITVSIPIRVELGTIENLRPSEFFDTILYIDVLEHIEQDAAELERVSHHLTPGGAIVVLSPAHQWLFSPFDQSIGHFRRYSRKTLAALAPPGMIQERIFYLDSVGLAASAANRFLLKASMPTPKQIQIWDKLMVPASRLLDPLLAYGMGKSIAGIWRKAKS